MPETAAQERQPHPVDAPLVEPSASNGLIAVVSRSYLLRLLVKREISARYQGSFLGLIWSYINPLSQLFIYWFVLGKIVGLGDRTENFAIHVFCGLVVVHFFTETFNAGTRSIVRNKALVRKMAMPREMFPVASMLVSLFHVGPQLVILTGACLFYGWTPDLVGIAALVMSMVLIIILGTAAALFFSAANVFFRDIGSAVTIITNFVRFSVPMIYPFTLVEQRFGSFAQYYLFNPIADAVLMMQRAFWTGTTTDPEATIAVHMPDNLFGFGALGLGGSIALLLIAQVVFSRLENRIPERL